MDFLLFSSRRWLLQRGMRPRDGEHQEEGRRDQAGRAPSPGDHHRGSGQAGYRLQEGRSCHSWICFCELTITLYVCIKQFNMKYAQLFCLNFLGQLNIVSNEVEIILDYYLQRLLNNYLIV